MNTEAKTLIRALIRTELMLLRNSDDVHAAIEVIKENKYLPYDDLLTVTENEERGQFNVDKLIAYKGLLGQIEAIFPADRNVTLIPEGELKAHIKKRTGEGYEFNPEHFPYCHIDWDIVVETMESSYYEVSAHNVNFYIEGE